MKIAKIYLTILSMTCIASVLFAYKSRGVFTAYVVNSTSPNLPERLCTKTTHIFYTTNIPDALPGAVGIINLPYYTASVLSTSCPTTVWYSAL